MHSTLSSITIAFGVLATSVLAIPQTGSATSGTASMTASVTVSAATSTASNIHHVLVGPGLEFSPNMVSAAVGDWVTFQFQEGGHSVAQSSFANPCNPIGANAVYSGELSEGDVWRVQINSTDPLWMYCSTPSHCEGGMAMVINQAATGSNNINSYKSSAQNAQGSSPKVAMGGLLNNETPASSSSSMMSSASATQASATASSTGAASPMLVSGGLMVLGALAAGVAAVL